MSDTKKRKTEKEYLEAGTRHGKYAGNRSRYFVLLLYPDNPVHVDVMNWIKEKEDYVAILHDSDILEKTENVEKVLDTVLEGTDESQTHDNVAKSHWHVIVRFPNVRTLKGVKKYFGNDVDNFIKLCSDPYSFAVYMLHDTYECKKKHKHLYSYADVMGVTSLKTRLFSTRRGVFVEKVLTEIISIIDSRQVTSLRALLKYMLRHEKYDLIEFVTAHSFLVKSLLISEEKLDSGYGSDAFIPEHSLDDSPLVPDDISFSCESDIITPDYLFSQRTQDVFLSNRAQRRKKIKKEKRKK